MGEKGCLAVKASLHLLRPLLRFLYKLLPFTSGAVAFHALYT